MINVPSDGDEKEPHVLLKQNRELQQKVKRLSRKLKMAKREAEERLALLKVSKEKLVDIIIDAKYHSGEL